MAIQYRIVDFMTNDATAERFPTFEDAREWISEWADAQCIADGLTEGTDVYDESFEEWVGELSAIPDVPGRWNAYEWIIENPADAEALDAQIAAAEAGQG